MPTLLDKLGVIVVACVLFFALGSATGQTPQANAPAPAPAPTGIEALREEMNRIAFEPAEVPSRQLQDIEERFDRLAAAGSALPADWWLLLHLELRSWRFARIDAYRNATPAAAPTPWFDGRRLPSTLVGEDRPGAPFWALDFKRNELRHSTIETADAPFLMVVFHPLCGVCKRLTADVDTNPALARFMRECAVWVGTVEGNFSTNVFQGWAETHPSLPLRFVRDWSHIGSHATFATPTFRAMKGGRVVDELVGWPREGGQRRLNDFLEKNGVPLESGCRSGFQSV